MRLFSIYHINFFTGLLLTPCVTRAQEPPPKPISVYVNPAQGLIFGAFFQGITGGTVINFIRMVPVLLPEVLCRRIWAIRSPLPFLK